MFEKVCKINRVSRDYGSCNRDTRCCRCCDRRGECTLVCKYALLPSCQFYNGAVGDAGAKTGGVPQALPRIRAKWDNGKCTNCGTYQATESVVSATLTAREQHYCYNCGAYMGEGTSDDC